MFAFTVLAAGLTRGCSIAKFRDLRPYRSSSFTHMQVLAVHNYRAIVLGFFSCKNNCRKIKLPLQYFAAGKTTRLK